MRNKISISIPASFYFLIFFVVSIACQEKQREKELSLYPELNKFFQECEVYGSIVIYDKNNDNWIVNDTVGIYEASLPASTFKILNLLIALETGVIDDEEEVIYYKGNVDTTRYGYRPGTYRDMTVREAFEASAVWVFLDLAERISKDTYREYLHKVNYGNQQLYTADLDFWNLGELAISAVDQVKFLTALYEGNLPFSQKNMDIVKDVMLTEIGSNYNVHGKTGWTRKNGMNIGWWIGYVEQGTDVYFFATRILQDRKNYNPHFGICRKRITENIFEHLKLLNQ